MDTKAIEKFSIEAREQLLKDVEQRLYIYGLDDAGRSEFGIEADAVRGTVLTATEKRQRTELFRRIEQEGTLPFITEMAYTWFNRFAAIRYMELHDFLPSHVRMLSAADGSFEPECLKAATTLDLPGLDRMEIAQLIQAGDDERLYRVILIAQCNELASFLPSVFGTVTADALTMPANLLRKNEFNVLYRLVTDIPEDEWQDVEILGWMYQFYNSEVKAEFFKSKRKAAAEDIAPATQLFTPEWIVRYMVDNSLGRLWMLNHPESHLRDRSRAENSSERLMEYYIEPDEKHEDFIQATNPEDITFCDPACGSGHILVYAFKMLMAIYEECGYREREIPELILTKNLSGFEIDPRAAQIATLALALCAREHDRRFFDRGITADIIVLQDIEIDTDSLLLTSPLREKPELLENLANLGEIGSLFQPSAEDIAVLEADLADAAGDNLFTSHASSEVERALATCRTLARRFDVVVANPPYLSSSKFNKYMQSFTKNRYPNSWRNLYGPFIERCLNLCDQDGYASLVTLDSWMAVGSFEKLRDELTTKCTVVTLAYLGSGSFEEIGGEIVSVATFVLMNTISDISGVYFKLNKIAGAHQKELCLLSAASKQADQHRHQVKMDFFRKIPGHLFTTFWGNNALAPTFLNNPSFKDVAHPRVGMQTGKNDLFVRMWWEVSRTRACFNAADEDEFAKSKCKWAPYSKGGHFRKWYGNLQDVVNWENEGAAIKDKTLGGNRSFSILPAQYRFREAICWNDISKDGSHYRFRPAGSIFDIKSMSCFPPQERREFVLGLCNSTAAQHFIEMLAPSMNNQIGDIGKLPIISIGDDESGAITQKVRSNISISRIDWDSQETSWDFKRSPLI